MQTQTTITRRIAQTTAEDLHRLANQAERKGVRLLVDHRTGQHVATSASNPTTCYHVDVARGCTCKGYVVWGRCGHWALLLAELGQLPDMEMDAVLDEQPMANPVVTAVVVEPAPCRSCRGAGFTRAYIGGGLSDWVAVPCGCRAVAPAA
ncbi:MAG: hypothetical protein M3R02_23375 [Chloroflexota bacterium]|nr:hypothetical protein [Chloroflexota bacterium]